MKGPPPRRSAKRRFRTRRELARGGMGAVFEAYDTSSGHGVALKRLLPDAPSKAAASFEREFYVLSSLKHPRIIEAYEYGVDEDGAYYTMELLPGSDLHALAPVDVETACRYLRDVASSLALLHARRLLHRDVSPRNVRTSPDGRCKLIDFGALTAFGVAQDIVGTTPAIPPEALRGQPLDQRADLFSLGALAYWLLTRRHAYVAPRIPDLPAAWQRPVPPPSALAPGIPAALDRLILSLLSQDVLARPSNAAEVIERLNVIGGLQPESDWRMARAYLTGAELVEREPPLEKVARALERLRSEGRGASLFVSAVSGHGKSRFIAEACLRAQLSGMTVLFADASARSGKHSTLDALLRQLCLLLPDVARRILGPHAASLRPMCGDLSSVLSVPPPEDDPGRLQLSSADSLEWLEGCVLDVAAEHPLMVAVDNVEQADAESAALLLELARSHRRNLLVVSTAGHPTDARSRIVTAIQRESKNVRLRALTGDGVSSLVRAVFGDVPHVGRTAASLFQATEGSPALCMALMEMWIERGMVGYSGGGWTLPIELPDEALPRLVHAEDERLAGCSETARALAETLSIVEGPVSMDVCGALVEHGDRSALMAALEELVEAGILATDDEHYTFQRDALRRALSERLPAERRMSLHARRSEALLETGTTSLARFEAGRHFILAGQPVRGAELIAKEARAVLEAGGRMTPIFMAAMSPLEAALEVYRQEERPSLQRLDLLVPLAMVGYEVSYDFSLRHGFEAMSRLERALGLATAAGRRPLEDVEALTDALAAAPVLEPGEPASEAAPDAATLVGWLMHVAISVTGTAAAAIDHESEIHAAAALKPFTLLGPDDPAAVAHEYCRLILMLSEDRLEEAHQRWSRLLARVDELPLPDSMVEPLRMGALSCLGTLECKRDDDAALVRLDALERMGTASAAVIAHRLRFLYYGFRGEIELAERHRDQVEAYAMARGSAWQVEVWSTSTLSAVYSVTGDRTGNRRAVEQLEKLKSKYPSLEQFWERALGFQHLLNNEPKQAIDVLERTLARSEPRERIGWAAVRGGLAAAYNRLGQHETARRICEETLELNEEDRDYVALNLTVRLQLCIAEAGLGRFEASEQRLRELLERHAPRRHPVTMGRLHRTGAHIALMAGDEVAFEHHLAEMESWFGPTRNPALIVQGDELRHAARLAGIGGAWLLPAAAGGSSTEAATVAQPALAGFRGDDERRRRALELIAHQVGAADAWLFGGGPAGRPVLLAKLGTEPPDEALLGEVEAIVRRCAGDDESTQVEETARAPSLSTDESIRYRSFPLMLPRDGVLALVGVFIVPWTRHQATVSPYLIHDLAIQLFEAGDVGRISQAS